MKSEYAALIVAALALLVVLIASFMCTQLYRLRKPAPPGASAPLPGAGAAQRADPREPFLGRFYYAPMCDTGYADTRAACHGVTAGAMPSIEVGGDRGGGLCPGLLGVPP